MSAEVILLPVVAPYIIAAWAGKTLAEIALEVKRQKNADMQRAQQILFERLKKQIETEEAQKEKLCARILRSVSGAESRIEKIKARLQDDAGAQEALEAVLAEVRQLKAETGELRSLPRQDSVDAVRRLNRQLLEKEAAIAELCKDAEGVKAGYENALAGHISGMLGLDLSAPSRKEAPRETKEYDRLRKLLDSLAAMELTKDMEARLEDITARAGESLDETFLRGLYTLEAVPLEKEALEYAGLLEEYRGLVYEYAALAERCGAERKAFSCTREGVRALKKEKEALFAELQKEYEREYVARAVNEVFEEMGYSSVGSRSVTKKNGSRFTGKLYQLEGGTAVDVTFSEDGQISMELGGLDTVDRGPDAAEQQELAGDMESFCGDYRKIAERLAEKGIDINLLKELPPQPAYATIINLSDYEHTENAVLKKKQRARGAARKDRKRTLDG
ncbi:MAG: hypothetical protein ILO36_04785 [Abditibacteriota bacterium]|nr:hypothetical protein [Abditibacteriota bacterium]